jgi:hypothetical protein
MPSWHWRTTTWHALTIAGAQSGKSAGTLCPQERAAACVDAGDLPRAVASHCGDAATPGIPARFNVPDPMATDRVRGLPAVRIAVYHDMNGPVRPDSFLVSMEWPARSASDG